MDDTVDAMARTGMLRISRPAQLGLMALVFIIFASAASYFILKYVRGTGGYQIGVRFPTAAGVGPGAQVYLSGVVIGQVTKVKILPDASVEFIISVFQGTDIPKHSKFSVLTSVTGTPSVAITPPLRRVAQNQVPTPMPRSEVLPKRILPVERQPVGTPPLTVESLMRESRTLGNRAYAMLAQARPYGTHLAYHLQHARSSAGATSQQLKETLPAVMAGVQSTIASAKANLRRAQNALTQRNQAKMTAIASSLEQSSRDMERTADALEGIKRDPRIQSNVRAASVQVRIISSTMANLARDMEMISGNPQTKAQLRDAGARLRAILQQL